MAFTAKVENYLNQRHGATKSVSVDSGTRACINCIWYEQHYRQNRGNIAAWVPTSYGYCLRHDQKRGALRQPCKDYETEDNKCK